MPAKAASPDMLRNGKLIYEDLLHLISEHSLGLISAHSLHLVLSIHCIRSGRRLTRAAKAAFVAVRKHLQATIAPTSAHQRLQFITALLAQGEREESQELQRLHLRLERANEHVSQLQARLAGMATSPSKPLHQPPPTQAQQAELEPLREQLTESQHSQQAQQAQIRALQAQLAHSKEAEQALQAQQDDVKSLQQQLVEAQHAQHAQQAQNGSLQQQLDACQAEPTASSLSSSSTETSSGHKVEVQALQAEVARLQGVVAQQQDMQLRKAAQYGVGADTVSVNLSEASTSGRPSEAGLSHTALATEWQQLAVREGATFCDQMRAFQLEHQQQQQSLTAQAHQLAEQQSTLTAQASQLAEQQKRFAEAEDALLERDAVLQSVSGKVTDLAAELADKTSVIRLQEEQLSVLQNKVDHLKAALSSANAAAEASSAISADKDAALQALQQEVASLNVKLQQHAAQSTAGSAGSDGGAQELLLEVAELKVSHSDEPSIGCQSGFINSCILSHGCLVHMLDHVRRRLPASWWH